MPGFHSRTKQKAKKTKIENENQITATTPQTATNEK